MFSRGMYTLSYKVITWRTFSRRGRSTWWLTHISPPSLPISKWASLPLNHSKFTVEDVEICLGTFHKIWKKSGGRKWLLFEWGLENNLIHGSFEFVLKDGHALIESEVVFGIDKLAVDALIGLVDEMHTEIVWVGTALEGTVEGTVVLADCIMHGNTVGGDVCLLSFGLLHGLSDLSNYQRFALIGLLCLYNSNTLCSIINSSKNYLKWW